MIPAYLYARERSIDSTNMPFQKGNSFWKLRKRHGPSIPFSSPGELQKKAQSYIDLCTRRTEDAAYWKKTEIHGKNAQKCMIQLYKPMSIEGLSQYLGISSRSFRRLRESEEFSSICQRIEDLIFAYQYEGACVGAFSPAIVARKLGMKDKHKVSSELKIERITGMEIR